MNLLLFHINYRVAVFGLILLKNQRRMKKKKMKRRKTKRRREKRNRKKEDYPFLL